MSGVGTSIRDMNRTTAPCPRHPSITGRSIRPITGCPDITHARTDRNRSNHGHRHGCDRRRDNDRQRQPDGEAEANSGVGRYCSHANKHGHEKHFCFHNFVQGVLPYINQYEVVSGILHHPLIFTILVTIRVFPFDWQAVRGAGAWRRAKCRNYSSTSTRWRMRP
jgi:hypothetical protein